MCMPAVIYPGSSGQQCLALLTQQINLLRLYPDAADYRATIVTLGWIGWALCLKRVLANHWRSLITTE